VNVDEFAWRMRQGYDLVVLVNPNNPTGRRIGRSDMESLLSTSLVARLLTVHEGPPHLSVNIRASGQKRWGPVLRIVPTDTDAMYKALSQ
jgi:hypothetical protein